MIKLKLIRKIFPSLVKTLKKLDKDQNFMSNSTINDSRLPLRMDRTKIFQVKEAGSKMDTTVHSYRSIITDSLKDASLILSFALNSQNNNETINSINHNFKTPQVRTVASYANLSVSNDPNVGCCNVSSSRLKSLGRQIASDLARSLYSHLLMTISTQFRVEVWHNKPKNLSSGVEACAPWT